jgi:energy coupling factor transporter S component ThiW
MLKNAALGGMFAALAVLLSPLSIPIGPSRCLPFQHAINAVAGVMLGPAWACGSAFAASAIRFMLGTGTILAFPGSMFGAAAVGLAAKFLSERRRFWAGLAEPCATGTIGAFAAALIASPPGGLFPMFTTLSVAFLMSSVPGAALGCAILRLRGIKAIRILSL